MSQSILHTRHSVRVFNEKEVEKETIKKIIADAQLAPSWCNSQPWKAYVATGEVAKQIVKKHHQNTLEKKSWTEVMPPQDENWNKASATNKDNFIAKLPTILGEEKNNEFLKLNSYNFNSLAIVYITVPKNSDAYKYYDAGAFGYGVTLAAHTYGVGSIPAYEFIRFPEEIREVFDIPEDEEILIGIGLGYAKEDKINDFYKADGRVPLDEMLVIK